MVAAGDIGPEGEALEGERRALLGGVSWAAYEGLRESVQGRHVHMTFLKGMLDQHEALKAFQRELRG